MIKRASASPLLFSCNHAIKFRIQEEYRNGTHYVWCSEFFDSRWDDSLKGRIPKSSNPAQIYLEMEAATWPFDKHDHRIERQKKQILNRATEWLSNDEISEDEYREIALLLKETTWDLWRPFLYVIPKTDKIDVRLEQVPPPERANTGMEYRISDLHNSEFGVVAFNRPLP